MEKRKGSVVKKKNGTDDQNGAGWLTGRTPIKETERAVTWGGGGGLRIPWGGEGRNKLKKRHGQFVG